MLPFSLKTGEAALYQIHPAMDDAAMSPGAKPVRVFAGIVVPMMLSEACRHFLYRYTSQARETQR